MVYPTSGHVRIKELYPFMYQHRRRYSMFKEARFDAIVDTGAFLAAAMSELRSLPDLALSLIRREKSGVAWLHF